MIPNDMSEKTRIKNKNTNFVTLKQLIRKEDN